MNIFKKYILCIVSFLLVLSFLPSNIKAEEKEYYSILIKENMDFDVVLSKLRSENQKVIYSIPEVKMLQVEGERDKIISAIDSNNIDEINPSTGAFKTYTPNINDEKVINPDSIWEQQWDMKRITHNGESYKLHKPSGKVSVAVIDSGNPEDHPDFQKTSSLKSKNLVPKGGYKGEEPSETGDINQLTDITGHGTSVLSQINANGLMKGVAPDMPVNMYRVFGSSSAEAIWIVKGIIEATKDENDIINISAGSYMLKTGKYSDGSENNSAEIKAYRKAIDYANKKGSIVVSAIGNDSVNINKNSELLNVLNNRLKDEGKFAKGIVQDIPSQLPHVISVASTGPNQTVASFSNYGRNAIDFTAPGGDIELLNTHGPEKWMEDELFKKEIILVAHPQGGYYFNYGNSLAAPKVSAALALIIDKYGYKKNPNKAIQHLKRNCNTNNEIDLYKSLQK
ncbi:S8 family peptidase [Bacillus toyonensis]|uniref:Leader peptide-processing serine protease n=2 Tax=Bacillus cereus group TaxID=86661 RepID=A0AB36SQ33_9BACI|nr:S8 family serine peptidase [Bacillus toyonensis]MCU4969222.1 S8 family serine peptidase [Bacillus toyonensis]PDZ33679.1 peptidase S8 [Bacillus toyonensis]PEI49338.1 peptidase S8 [Bacillus toyonensis]PEJ12250.1 peptidase S8 [Bacillus toyonensis]PEJ86635.1 peptidase S8 [Bacillus toyonensis]